MPVEDSGSLIGMVKIFTRLELDETISFLDGHYLRKKLELKLNHIAGSYSFQRLCEPP